MFGKKDPFLAFTRPTAMIKVPKNSSIEKKNTSGTYLLTSHPVPIKMPPNSVQLWTPSSFRLCVSPEKSMEVTFSVGFRMAISLLFIGPSELMKLRNRVSLLTIQKQLPGSSTGGWRCTGALCPISSNLATAWYIKMKAMRQAKHSSVNRVMYRTRELKSNATISNSKNVVHNPTHTLSGMKSQPNSLLRYKMFYIIQWKRSMLNSLIMFEIQFHVHVLL